MAQHEPSARVPLSGPRRHAGAVVDQDGYAYGHFLQMPQIIASRPWPSNQERSRGGISSHRLRALVGRGRRADGRADVVVVYCLEEPLAILSVRKGARPPQQGVVPSSRLAGTAGGVGASTWVAARPLLAGQSSGSSVLATNRSRTTVGATPAEPGSRSRPCCSEAARCKACVTRASSILRPATS